MSIELPRLPMFPPTTGDPAEFISTFRSWYADFQLWWQQHVDTTEAHETTQDALIANLATTDAEVTLAQAELATAQADLAQTQAELASAIADVVAAQAAADAAQSTADANTTALALKANLASPTFTGTVTISANITFANDLYLKAADGTSRIQFTTNGATLNRSGTDTGTLFDWRNTSNAVQMLLRDTGLDLTAGLGYRVGNVKVVGAQGLAIADAGGGVTVDAEARTAVNALLARVRAHGLIAT